MVSDVDEKPRQFKIQFALHHYRQHNAHQQRKPNRTYIFENANFHKVIAMRTQYLSSRPLTSAIRPCFVAPEVLLRIWLVAQVRVLPLEANLGSGNSACLWRARR